jgi:WXXGXW repeat (2 copies)
MRRIHDLCLVAPLLIALVGCGRQEPAPSTTQIIVQPPAEQLPSLSLVAPGPPPPPQSELVPPPSPGMGPVVWQPGHWRFSGNSWAWQPGQYVPPPPGQTTWIPGRWAQQSTGGWAWVEGHWA